jgi:septum formation topological specificity factor MinE
MVDQACEEPLMADILFERFTEYKRTQDADRAELQVVMTMSETIEGRIYGMQEKVKNEVLAVMERQVE